MGFLDKLKPQPRWKHADPAVRLEALKELDDLLELGVMAESDADVRVRRSALGRVVAADVLGRIANADADQETRDRAAERLVALASRTGGAESDTDALALEAVRQLNDSRRLSTVAKSEAGDAVRAEALA